jgi:hypothetical protein
MYDLGLLSKAQKNIQGQGLAPAVMGPIRKTVFLSSQSRWNSTTRFQIHALQLKSFKNKDRDSSEFIDIFLNRCYNYAVK